MTPASLTIGLTAAVLVLGCRREPPPAQTAAPPAATPASSPRDLGSADRSPPSAPSPAGRALPANVPETARWIGGPDGGAFVWFDPSSNAGGGVLRGKVFHENGDLWFAGVFIITPPGARIDIADATSFIGWDGERLHLSGGRSLRAARPRAK